MCRWLLFQGTTPSSKALLCQYCTPLPSALGSAAKLDSLPLCRRSFKEGYEEVHVPAPPRAPPPEPGELVEISAMEDWAQLAFAGYKTLNRIQSRIYKTAFHSNENILVCAPTGARQGVGATHGCAVCNCCHWFAVMPPCEVQVNISAVEDWMQLAARPVTGSDPASTIVT